MDNNNSNLLDIRTRSFVELLKNMTIGKTVVDQVSTNERKYSY